MKGECKAKKPFTLKKDYKCFLFCSNYNQHAGKPRYFLKNLFINYLFDKSLGSQQLMN